MPQWMSILYKPVRMALVSGQSLCVSVCVPEWEGLRRNATPQHDKGFLDRWRWGEFLNTGRSHKITHTPLFRCTQHWICLNGSLLWKWEKLGSQKLHIDWTISFLNHNYQLSFTVLLLDANEQLSRGHQEDLGHKVWKRRLLRFRLLLPFPGPPTLCNLPYISV